MAIRLPRGVMIPSELMAPNDVSNAVACAKLAAGGGVSHGKCVTSVSPNAEIERRVGAKSAVSISALRCSFIKCSVAFVHSR